MAKVFISYSKRDYIGEDGKVLTDNVVDKVCKALSDNGITYWIDREGLDLGITYADTIAKSIRECDTFLFLSTEKANSSPWTLREISTAIDFGKTVLPVKLDHSKYADSVSLYLASVQYVDWMELGADESLRKIVSRIKGGEGEDSLRHFEKEKLPLFTSIALYAGIVFLTGIYAVLTYQFLWAKSLRSSEIMGGFVGFVCEFSVLTSIYYLIRILRLRRCVFAVPVIVIGITFLSGMLLRDGDVMLSAILLLMGWVFILAACLVGGTRGKNFFRIMSREQILLRLNDPENLIFVYLAIKAVIIVLSHYLGLSMDHALISPHLF
jgi:hypothetical protein